MARTLLQEIAHQIFSSPKKRSNTPNKTRNKSLEEAQYKLKQVAFEAKKEFEIAKHKAKSKGWI